MASGLLQGKPLAFCDRQKQPKMHGEQSSKSWPRMTAQLSQLLGVIFSCIVLPTRHFCSVSSTCQTPSCFNAGTVSDRGMIACSCAKCVRSGAQHSSSEWEVHAGSRERRPAESIYLTELNFSLRVRTP